MCLCLNGEKIRNNTMDKYQYHIFSPYRVCPLEEHRDGSLFHTWLTNMNLKIQRIETKGRCESICLFFCYMRRMTEPVNEFC